MIFHNGIAIVEGDTHLSKWVVEQNTLEVAKQYCQLFKRYIPEGSVVIDVGACIGDMTATFATMVGPMGRVIAFEPNPIAFECLKHNMATRENVSVLQIGLGDKTEGVAIHHAERTQDNLGATQLRGWGSVLVKPMDMVLMGEPKRISFIKIDAEGWEPRIIHGALETIRKHRPVLLIEINRPILAEMGYCALNVTAPLENLGYKITPSEPHIPFDSEMLDILCIP